MLIQNRTLKHTDHTESCAKKQAFSWRLNLYNVGTDWTSRRSAFLKQGGTAAIVATFLKICTQRRFQLILPYNTATTFPSFLHHNEDQKHFASKRGAGLHRIPEIHSTESASQPYVSQTRLIARKRSVSVLWKSLPQKPHPHRHCYYNISVTDQKHKIELFNLGVPAYSLEDMHIELWC